MSKVKPTLISVHIEYKTQPSQLCTLLPWKIKAKTKRRTEEESYSKTYY